MGLDHKKKKRMLKEEKILIAIIIFFSHNLYKSLFQGHKNMGLFCEVHVLIEILPEHYSNYCTQGEIQCQACCCCFL